MKRLAKAVPFLAIACFLWMFVQSQTYVLAKTDNSRISEGIYIEELYIGGMTAEEAQAALDEYVAELGRTEFMLMAGEKRIVFTADEMGFAVSNDMIIKEAVDVGKTGSLLKRYKDLTDLEHGDLIFELNLGVDREQIVALLTENIEKINTKAVNNGLIRENGEFTYVEGQTGVAVDVEASATLIEEYIVNEWALKPVDLALCTEVAMPRGTKEELAKVKDLLSSYSTNFSSSVAGRVKNVEVATERINGTVLYPGEEFSVNETIQPRDAAHGYEIAASYLSGATVQSYGGGVCQVSTTLYNAVILAELQISERSSHSMTVAYVPIAMDAAIAGDYMDLKFVNNTESPIYIEGYTKNKNLYFNIYGEETRASNRKVSFETEILSVEDPGTKFVGTGEPVGTVRKVQSKHYGYKSKLWKIITVDGVQTDRIQFNKSNYRSSPRIVNIGTGAADPSITAEIQAAIATGDEATIYAAIGKYADVVPAAGDAGPVLPASAATENPADSSGV